MIVHLQGSDATREVSVAEIDQWFDLPQANYAIRSRAGQSQPASESVGNALSIRELVGRLASEPGTPFSGIAADSVALVTVPDPRNGHLATLSPPNLGPSGDNGFADGKLPALFAAANDSVGYVRPLTSDPDDVNVQDYIQANAQGALDITLSLTGTVLQPRVTATPDDPEAGDAVRFDVTVPNASPNGLTYSWTFDGGGTSTAASPSYTWDTNGTYAANVVVRGRDGSTGQASVTVSVGTRPQASPTAGATPGSGAGGGTNPDQNAPSKGPDEGSDGTRAGGKVSETPGPDDAATPGAGPDGSQGSDGGSSGATGRSDDGTVSGVPAPPPDALPPPTAQTLPAAGAGEIAGLLLSSGSVAVGPAADDDPREVTAPTARAQPASTAIDPVVWVALLGPLLLAAGAVRELRPRLRRVKA